MADHDQTVTAGTRLPGAAGRAGCEPPGRLVGLVRTGLTDAGFSLHHCTDDSPLYRLGGVCVLQVPARPGEHPAGVTVSWTTHNALACDESRWATYSVLIHVMNTALGTVLRTMGYDPAPFGAGGAWIISSGGEHPAGAS